MARGGSSLIIVVISLFYVLASFWRLLQLRKYFEFALVFIVYFGLALILYFGFTYSFNLETPGMRVWVVAPFIVLLLFWLISGYFIRKFVLDSTSRSLHPIKSGPRLKLRLIGAILTCTGLSVWLYGRFVPFTDDLFIWALMFSLVCLILGLPYLVTGKKIGK
jgi:hypothetical protein